MKKRMVTLVAGTVSLFVAGAAQAEVRIGNGGDALAAQFVETADDLVQIVQTALANRNLDVPSGLNFEALRERIRTAKVFSSEKTMLGTVEVDAINYPFDNKIVFSRSRFSKIALNLKAQRTLVIHEYMGLAGIDDSTYKFSNFLVRKAMNGGDKGELWLLKDLTVPGFQNPFRGAVLELSVPLFVGYTGSRQRTFQGGSIVSSPASQKPYCVLSTNGMQTPADPTVRTIRVPVSGAEAQDAGGLGTDVVVRMLRPTIVPSLRCSSGSAWRRVTLSDMLDALGNHASFAHEGSASFGNVICRDPE